MRMQPSPAHRPHPLSGRVVSVSWLAALLLALAGCATGNLAAPSVQQLSQHHYAPTQTVDVLSTPPSVPFEPIARLHLADPTGVATSSQLIAQLSDTAKNLGANALVVEQVVSAGGAGVSFNPAGGQMQGSTTESATPAVTALAIRYTH